MVRAKFILYLALCLIGTLFSTFLITYLSLSVANIKDSLLLILFFVSINFLLFFSASPLIEKIYKVNEATRNMFPTLHSMIEELSAQSRLKKPKVMISNLPLPYAITYRDVLFGSKLAVSFSLLGLLESNELKALISHETKHVKDKDHYILSYATVLPSLLYIAAKKLIYPYFKNKTKVSTIKASFGFLFLLLHFFFNIFNLPLSRFREECADDYVSELMENGKENLFFALTKVTNVIIKMRNEKSKTLNLLGFKTLLITDPDCVSGKLEKEGGKKLLSELFKFFSTHPSVQDRLNRLKD